MGAATWFSAVGNRLAQGGLSGKNYSGGQSVSLAPPDRPRLKHGWFQFDFILISVAKDCACARRWRITNQLLQWWACALLVRSGWNLRESSFFWAVQQLLQRSLQRWNASQNGKKQRVSLPSASSRRKNMCSWVVWMAKRKGAFWPRLLRSTQEDYVLPLPKRISGDELTWQLKSKKEGSEKLTSDSMSRLHQFQRNSKGFQRDILYRIYSLYTPFNLGHI